MKSVLVVVLLFVISLPVRAEETTNDEPTESFTLADSTQASDKQDHHFKAEINQLMKLIINSLYSNRDIFVRELVSNAADALDKIRYLSLTDSSALAAEPRLEIKIKVEPENKMIHIRDTGIGMTQADMLNNLGSIAKSGTKEFIKEIQAGKSDLTQIGQFGVGFYSSFLVADKVVVTSKNNKDDQYIWESSMDDAASFTVYKDPRGNTLGRGTQVTLHIKDTEALYLAADKIKELVRHYNEFITFPIFIWDSYQEEIPQPEEPEETEGEEPEVQVEESEETEGEEKEKPPTHRTVWHWEQVNTAKPLWTRPAAEIPKEDYSKFFKSLGDYEDPISFTHFKAEGELEFTALLYIPATVPPASYDFSTAKSNVKLYVKRVFISEKFDELLPSYLSFIKGITDSDDLDLNVSREMLQQSKLLKAIQRKLVRKVIQMIQDLSEAEDQEPWEKFWKNYHQFVKLGITRDQSNKIRLAKLVRFHSLNSGEKQIGLEEYVASMKEGQKSIYYFGGEDIAVMRKSPLLERALKKGLDVLLFNAPIDEYMAGSLGKFDNFQLVDISKGNLLLEGDSTQEEFKESFKPLTEYLTESLKGKVSRVEVTTRLTETPCALVSPQWGMSSNMERIAKAQALQGGHSMMPQQKKILEINPRHPIIKKLLSTVQASEQTDETLDVVTLLVDTAALHSGVTLEDPLVVAGRLDKVIAHALGVDPSETLDEEEIEVLPEKQTEKKEEEKEDL